MLRGDVMSLNELKFILRDRISELHDIPPDSEIMATEHHQIAKEFSDLCALQFKVIELEKGL